MNIVNVGYHATNYYVLADNRPLLLVDAGWPGSLAEMRHSCKRMGVRLEDIEYQLVTHYHPDHAGLAEELKRLGIRLIVIDIQVAAIGLMREYVKASDGYTEIGLEGNIVLSVVESRDFLEKVGIKGEVISTPGHSDDSVTLVLDDGAAFTGDLTPLTAVPDDPVDLAFQSWQKIRALGARTIYPGHGPVGRL